MLTRSLGPSRFSFMLENCLAVTHFQCRQAMVVLSAICTTVLVHAEWGFRSSSGQRMKAIGQQTSPAAPLCRPRRSIRTLRAAQKGPCTHPKRSSPFPMVGSLSQTFFALHFARPDLAYSRRYAISGGSRRLARMHVVVGSLLLACPETLGLGAARSVRQCSPREMGCCALQESCFYRSALLRGG